jgi:hypothetical protein
MLYEPSKSTDPVHRLQAGLAYRSLAMNETTNAMPVHLVDWKPLIKGSLRGFAKVRLGRSLLINDIPVLYSNGRAWAGMPGKPLIGADGTGLRDDKGRQRYVSVLEWTKRESSDRFSEAVIAAIERLHGSLSSEAA